MFRCEESLEKYNKNHETKFAEKVAIDEVIKKLEQMRGA